MDGLPFEVLIGFDVGWNKNKPTCGLALNASPSRSDSDDGWESTGTISHKNLFLREVPETIECIARNYSGKRVLIVVDAPLGTGENLLPDPYRTIDRVCSSKSFYNRATCASLSSGTGQGLIRAIQSVICHLQMAFPSSCGVLVPGCPLPSERIVFSETNPTIALALSLEKQEYEQIASRNRPKEPIGGGQPVRCKSDWYWRSGSSHWVSEALGEPCITSITDHEEVAALTCLALARGLVSRKAVCRGSVFLGDRKGSFLIPENFGQSWRKELEGIGLHKLESPLSVDQPWYV